MSPTNQTATDRKFSFPNQQIKNSLTQQAYDEVSVNQSFQDQEIFTYANEETEYDNPVNPLAFSSITN